MPDSLDLDAIIPEKKNVHVNGKDYEILPLTLKDFLNFQRLVTKIQGKTDSELVDVMGEVFETMRAVVPQLDEMNLTMPQTFALLTFIYKQEEPQSQRELVDEQKKTDQSLS